MQTGGPPDTSPYFHVAYAWVAAVYVGYSALLWLRGRRIRRAAASAEQREPQVGRAG